MMSLLGHFYSGGIQCSYCGSFLASQVYGIGGGNAVAGPMLSNGCLSLIWGNYLPTYAGSTTPPMSRQMGTWHFLHLFP